METTSIDSFESFDTNPTVEPMNSTRVSDSFEEATPDTKDIEKLATEEDSVASSLVDLGGVSLNEVLTTNNDVLDASMNRLLHGIDNAAGSFGGYNPNQSEQ